MSYIILYCNDDWCIRFSAPQSSPVTRSQLVRAWCLQLGLGLGLGPANGIISAFFFPLCFKVTKTFVLLSWHVQYDVHVRTTVRDVMMMYSKDRYMENLP